MYTIKRTDYGLFITMGGIYQENEISRYLKEKKEHISSIGGPFSLVVDLRNAMPPKVEDSSMLIQAQKELSNQNLERMTIIVSSPVMKASATQVLFNSGMHKCTRVIDASKSPDWEEQAISWIKSGVEPQLVDQQ